MTAARYAVYWTPDPRHPLWQAGCEWLRRRLAAPALSTTQREALACWGYPHVFQHWRFHMTLSDPLADEDPRRETLRSDAQRHFAEALAEPLPCASICVFAEPAPGTPF